MGLYSRRPKLAVFARLDQTAVPATIAGTPPNFTTRDKQGKQQIPRFPDLRGLRGGTVSGFGKRGCANVGAVEKISWARPENSDPRLVLVAGLAMTTTDDRFDNALELVRAEAASLNEDRIAVITTDPHPRDRKRCTEPLFCFIAVFFGFYGLFLLSFLAKHFLAPFYGSTFSSSGRRLAIERIMRHGQIQTTMAYYVDLDADDVAGDLWVDFGNNEASNNNLTTEAQEREKRETSN